MLSAGMSARDVARHFQRHESTISRLLNRFQQTGNVAYRPGSGKPRKTTPREGRFLTTSSRHNRFLSSRALGRLLRNAIVTRVCDKTVRNRLHTARLKGCCPYVGIPLTLRHRETRLQWARVHQGLTRRQWRNVLFSDESRFNVSFADDLQDHRISLPLSTYGTTCQVRKCHDVNNIPDLERALQAEWARIPLQVIRKLICSMRRRCLAVLAVNGGHTRY